MYSSVNGKRNQFLKRSKETVTVTGIIKVLSPPFMKAIEYVNSLDLMMPSNGGSTSL